MKDTISRKKLYKSGKLWVAALVSTVAVAGSSVAMADSQQNAGSSNQPVNVVQTVNNSAQPTSSTASNGSAANEQAKAQPVQDNNQGATAGSQNVQQNQDQLNDFAQKFVDEANAEGANIDPKTFNQKQIDALNKLEQYTTTPRKTDTTKYTYYQFQQAADKVAEVDPQFAIPYFKADQIKNLPAATSKDGQTGKIANMDIWDSWPVQDPTTGHIVNWHGKQLVIAMMGTPNANSNHLYLLYND